LFDLSFSSSTCIIGRTILLSDGFRIGQASFHLPQEKEISWNNPLVTIPCLHILREDLGAHSLGHRHFVFVMTSMNLSAFSGLPIADAQQVQNQCQKIQYIIAAIYLHILPGVDTTRLAAGSSSRSWSARGIHSVASDEGPSKSWFDFFIPMKQAEIAKKCDDILRQFANTLYERDEVFCSHQDDRSGMGENMTGKHFCDRAQASCGFLIKPTGRFRLLYILIIGYPPKFVSFSEYTFGLVWL
jgi:hypothetical protein